MARKNIFDFSNSDAPDRDPEEQPVPPVDSNRPLSGLDRERSNRPAALGAISQSLEKITARSARAEEIENQLAGGQTIIEINPDLIDGSFISDRLGFDDEDQTQLVEQIRQNGQLVPILVRPSQVTPGRYQIAYGHRRVAAIRALGLKVRAVVKNMSDEELVIHQGQENNTRSNLSFIEKAFFAYRLEKSGYSREVLYQSTGIDKAVLSKMITVIKTIPEEVIRKIGRAPQIGRNRWEALSALMDTAGAALASKAVHADGFGHVSSDERFQIVFDTLRSAVQKAEEQRNQSIVPVFSDGLQPIEIKRNGDKVQFIFHEKIAPDFADFIHSRLGALYDAFIESQREKN